MTPKLQPIDDKVLERLKLGPVSIGEIRESFGLTDAQARASLDRLSRRVPQLYEESIGRRVVYKLAD